MESVANRQVRGAAHHGTVSTATTGSNTSSPQHASSKLSVTDPELLSPMSPTDPGSAKTQAAKDKPRKSRPKGLYFWTSEDVLKWMRKHCSFNCQLYEDLFRQHEISGRNLVRITDWKLQMIGVTKPLHRQEILQSITRLKLKADAQELKNLSLRQMTLAKPGSPSR